MAHYFYHAECPEGHEVYRDQVMVAGPFQSPMAARVRCEQLAMQESDTAVLTVLPMEFDVSHIDSTWTISRSCWKVNDPAAVALGSHTSEKKKISSAENGAKGGRPIDWHARAERRVDQSDKLSPHKNFIMADWPEGDEHWKWVAEATVEEIVDWAEANH